MASPVGSIHCAAQSEKSDPPRGNRPFVVQSKIEKEKKTSRKLLERSRSKHPSVEQSLGPRSGAS